MIKNNNRNQSNYLQLSPQSRGVLSPEQYSNINRIQSQNKIFVASSPSKVSVYMPATGEKSPLRTINMNQAVNQPSQKSQLPAGYYYNKQNSSPYQQQQREYAYANANFTAEQNQRKGLANKIMQGSHDKALYSKMSQMKRTTTGNMDTSFDELDQFRRYQQQKALKGSPSVAFRKLEFDNDKNQNQPIPQQQQQINLIQETSPFQAKISRYGFSEGEILPSSQAKYEEVPMKVGYDLLPPNSYVNQTRAVAGNRYYKCNDFEAYISHLTSKIGKYDTDNILQDFRNTIKERNEDQLKIDNIHNDYLNLNRSASTAANLNYAGSAAVQKVTTNQNCAQNTQYLQQDIITNGHPLAIDPYALNKNGIPPTVDYLNLQQVTNGSEAPYTFDLNTYKRFSESNIPNVAYAVQFKNANELSVFLEQMNNEVISQSQIPLYFTRQKITYNSNQNVFLFQNVDTDAFIQRVYIPGINISKQLFLPKFSQISLMLIQYNLFNKAEGEYAIIFHKHVEFYQFIKDQLKTFGKSTEIVPSETVFPFLAHQREITQQPNFNSAQGWGFADVQDIHYQTAQSVNQAQFNQTGVMTHNHSASFGGGAYIGDFDQGHQAHQTNQSFNDDKLNQSNYQNMYLSNTSMYKQHEQIPDYEGEFQKEQSPYNKNFGLSVETGNNALKTYQSNALGGFNSPNTKNMNDSQSFNNNQTQQSQNSPQKTNDGGFNFSPSQSQVPSKMGNMNQSQYSNDPFGLNSPSNIQNSQSPTKQNNDPFGLNVSQNQSGMSSPIKNANNTSISNTNSPTKPNANLNSPTKVGPMNTQGSTNNPAQQPTNQPKQNPVTGSTVGGQTGNQSLPQKTNQSQSQVQGSTGLKPGVNTTTTGGIKPPQNQITAQNKPVTMSQVPVNKLQSPVKSGNPAAYTEHHQYMSNKEDLPRTSQEIQRMMQVQTQLNTNDTDNAHNSNTKPVMNPSLNGLRQKNDVVQVQMQQDEHLNSMRANANNTNQHNVSLSRGGYIVPSQFHNHNQQQQSSSLYASMLNESAQQWKLSNAQQQSLLQQQQLQLYQQSQFQKQSTPQSTNSQQQLPQTQVLQLLRNGLHVQKFGFKQFFCSAPQTKTIQWSEDLSIFSWNQLPVTKSDAASNISESALGKKNAESIVSANKKIPNGRKVFNFGDVIEIIEGMKSENFQRYKKRHGQKDCLAFSIRTKSRTIDMIAFTVKDREQYVASLRQALNWFKSQQTTQQTPGVSQTNNFNLNDSHINSKQMQETVSNRVSVNQNGMVGYLPQQQQQIMMQQSLIQRQGGLQQTFKQNGPHDLRSFQNL